MALTLLFITMGDVAGMGAELPLLSYITHEMLTAAGASVLQQYLAFEQVAMGIPPSYSALVRAEAALPMPWAEHETLSALGANAFANRNDLFLIGFGADVTQTK